MVDRDSVFATRDGQNLLALVRQWQQFNDTYCVPDHAKTKLVYVKRYLASQGIQKIAHIDVPSIKAFSYRLSLKGSSPSSVKAHVGAISSFCEYLIDCEVLTANPCRRVKRPRAQEHVVVYYSAAQVQEILVTAAEQGIWLAVFIALHTGLRATEIRLLDWRHINLSTRILTVHNPVRSNKNKKVRYVPIGPALLEVLVPLARPDGFLFAKRNGAPWGYMSWYKMIKKLADALPHIFTRPRARGGPGNGWHGFRSTWITNCVNAGIPVHKVAQWAGHSNISVTQRYLFAAAGYDEDIEKL